MGEWPRILKVRPLEPYRLEVTFTGGAVRLYDCAPLLEDEAFQALRNRGFFANAHVEPNGCAVVSNDRVDLSEAEIWENGSAADPARR